MSNAGGYTEPRKADEQIQELCNQVKDQVEAKTGKDYIQFTAILYRTQVVAGINYLIKVDVGDSYLHLWLYQDLSDHVVVMKVQEHKKDDPLVPF
ncbi:cystatin-A5 [Poecilia reticulata]|uniref:Cystatin-B n=1 Tax=Poecilia reticulata TaxID=8081 RepID=A0A3P9Q7Q7_POERE|nr:PREDICTED: cystatin-A [Poecilia reticulata]